MDDDNPFSLYSEWSVVSMCSDSSVCNRRYLFTGAEEIDEVLYNRIEVFDGDKGYEKSLDTLWIQNLDGRYYRIDRETKEKTLVYDFTLSVGDVFSSAGVKQKVVDKSVLAGYDAHWTYANVMPQLVLEDVETQTSADIWFAGIGSLHTGIASPTDFSDCLWAALEYKCDHWGEFPDIAAFCVNRPEYKSIPFRPLAVSLSDPVTEGLSFEAEGDTLLIRGVARLAESVYNMRCFVQGTDIYLSLADIPYAMRINPGKGEVLREVSVAIPNMPTGTWTIHYDGQPPVIIDREETEVVREPYPTLASWHSHFIYAVKRDGERLQLRTFPSDRETKEFNGFEYTLLKVYTENIELPFPYYYRQDGDRVYRWKDGMTKEELVLDFGLSIGDEYVRSDGTKFVVTEVGDTTINAFQPHCKVLRLQGEENVTQQDVWIESCGSVYTGLLLPGDLSDVISMNVQYMWEEIDVCFWLDTETDYLKARHLLVDDEYEYADGKSSSLQFAFEGDSLHVTGGLVVTPPNLYLSLEIEDNEINFTWESLPPHMSTLKYVPIDMKFGRFAQGSYIIRFFNDEIELFCDGTPTSVGGLSSHVSDNPVLFDLQGRRLVHEPLRGIYIKDGRKVVKWAEKSSLIFHRSQSFFSPQSKKILTAVIVIRPLR